MASIQYLILASAIVLLMLVHGGKNLLDISKV